MIFILVNLLSIMMVEVVVKKQVMLKEFFEIFGMFSEEEIQEIMKMFSIRKMKKNEVFLEEGKKSKEVAFINSGIFRSFYSSSEGIDTTYCFCFPGNLMASYSAFISGNPSTETLQAISDAELLVVKKKVLDAYGKNSLKWQEFLKIIADQQYVELERRVFQLQRESALEKYQNLLKNQPEYLQQIPLHYLASYLGISQRHLSRIRKE